MIPSFANASRASHSSLRHFFYGLFQQYPLFTVGYDRIIRDVSFDRPV